jgi:hypothetical protein
VESKSAGLILFLCARKQDHVAARHDRHERTQNKIQARKIMPRTQEETRRSANATNDDKARCYGPPIPDISRLV